MSDFKENTVCTTRKISIHSHLKSVTTLPCEICLLKITTKLSL